MKASRFLGNKTFAVTDLPTPHAGPGELVLRNQVCGVCGTDLHIYHGEPGSADVNPPVVLGHEYSGEVVEVGEGVTGFAVGDHVTVDPNIYCGHCAYCQNGKKQLCPSMEAIGATRDGGFAQYSRIPASQAFKLEPTVPWEAAAMAEPLTISLHGIHRGGLKAGEYCAIIGAGPIGLAAAMVAQAYGAHAILLDLVQERLDFAKSLGVEYTINSGKEDANARVHEITGGEGAQQVMECSGANPAIRSTLDLVSHAGRITFTGWPKKETSLPTDTITRKEIDLRGARTSAGEFPEALELIATKKVDMLKLLTKTVKLEEVPETIIDIEKNPGSYMKVVVTME